MLKYIFYFFALHFISFSRLKSRRYLRSWNRGVRKTASSAMTLPRCRRPEEAVTVAGQHPPLPPPPSHCHHRQPATSRGSRRRRLLRSVTAITTPKRAAARMWPANSTPWTGPTWRRRNGCCGKLPPRCPSRTITVSSSSSNRLVQ